MSELPVGATKIPIKHEGLGIDLTLCLEHVPVMTFLAEAETLIAGREEKAPDVDAGTWEKGKHTISGCAELVKLAIKCGVLIGLKKVKMKPNAVLWLSNSIQEAVSEAVNIPPS